VKLSEKKGEDKCNNFLLLKSIINIKLLNNY